MAKAKTGKASTTPKQPSPPEAPPKNYPLSFWIKNPDDRRRIDEALKLFCQRLGIKVTQSAWLLSVVMKAVEEEERLAGKR